MKNLCINIHNDFSYDSKFLEKIDFNSKSEISFDYVSDFKSAKILRSFIGDLSDKLNIDKIWKSRLILVTDELNNNAIEYGSVNGDLNNLKVYFDPINNFIDLTIEVLDSGKGLKSKNASEMEDLRSSKKGKGFDNHKGIRGRGLFLIIEKLVDELYFKDNLNGGLIVGIKKKLKINKKD